MASIEGFYKFEYHVDLPPGMTPLGGVVVLETGRIFGGDSAYYYCGGYEMAGGKFVAKVQVRVHTETPGIASIFGAEHDDGIDLTVTAKKEGLHLRGTLHGPGMDVPFSLIRLDDLP